MSLRGKRAAVLAGPEYEDLELHYPLLRLLEEGAEVKVVAAKKDTVKGKYGLSVVPDLSVKEADPHSFDILVIPGGWAPDRLRRDPDVLTFTKDFFEHGRLVAAICHGPQVLISAGVLKGRRLTCVSAVKDDVMNAGAEYVDAPVIRDGNLITSRFPADLPDFCREIIRYFQP